MKLIHQCQLSSSQVFFSHFNYSSATHQLATYIYSYIHRMNTSVSLFVLVIMLFAAKPSLVNMMPIQSDSSNTTNISATTTSNPGQQFSLSRYTAMVHQLVGAKQEILFLLTQHVRLMCNDMINYYIYTPV